MSLTPEQLQQTVAEKRQKKRQHRRRRLVWNVLLVLVAVALAALTAYYTYHRGTLTRPPGPAPGAQLEEADAGRAAEGRRINVLILGTDQKQHEPGRTDMIMLASLDPETNELGVVAIPRDTRVQIPGRRGHDRINVAHAIGGPALVVRTVSQFLDVRIDHYVSINFAGFEQIVDTLGGVELTIERPMRYDDFAQNLHIDLPAGRHWLDGRLALHYVRFRADRLGDVSLVDSANEIYDGRVRRQLRFVQALSRQVLQPATLFKLPQLIPQMRAAIHTDMPVDRMISLSMAARSMDLDKIQMAVLPGVGTTIGGASYWEVDRGRAQQVVNRLIRGHQTVAAEVLNGSGVAGGAAQAADLLQEHGFEVVRVANADGFGYTATHIIPRDRLEAAQRVARTLPGQIVDEGPPPGGRPVDVTVIVGRDFRI